MNTVAFSRVRYASGALECLKYLAVFSMVADHVNKALFNSSLEWAVPLGRLAMPIFSAVLAYNFARPNADLGKAFQRLVLFGLLATPFHGAINGGGELPLNVMFTFAVAVACLALYQRGMVVGSAVAFLLGGFLVDYAWTGPLLVLSCFAFFRRPSTAAFIPVVVALAAMCALVGNPWAFLAVIPMSLATLYTPAVIRCRWFFWAFYPAHLALLWWLARV